MTDDIMNVLRARISDAKVVLQSEQDNAERLAREALSGSGVDGECVSATLVAFDGPHYVFTLVVQFECDETPWVHYLAMVETHEGENASAKILSTSTLVHMCLNLEFDEQYKIECRR